MKKERADLVVEFLKSRLSNIVKGIQIPYSEKELNIIHRCLSLQKRGTSETTRKAELAFSQLFWEKKLDKKLEKMTSAIQYKLSNKYTNQQIADKVGYKKGSSISWLMKMYSQNKLGLQKAGLIPLCSDDIVRPYVKA